MVRSSTDEQPRNGIPSPEEIRKRAFEIHVERGGIHGCDLGDWFQAERELQQEYKNQRKRQEKESRRYG
jgi:hypothetical protein